MTTVVLDSKDLVKSLETGEVPVPAEVAADRAGPQKAQAAGAAAARTQNGAAAEPEEDDNGLTPEQRATFTDAMKRTISRKHRQLKEAEEFAADQANNRRLSDARVIELERELAQLKQAAQAKPAAPAEAKKPERKDFQNDDAYAEALIDFRVKEQLAKERTEAAKAAQEAERAKAIEAVRAKITRAIELVPDYQEVVGAVDKIVPAHIASYMQESEKFAELGYHFAQHPGELDAIAAMPARTAGELMRVGVALDAISAKLRPFAPASPQKPAAKANGNGTAKPSPETESAGGSAGPSTETESGESPADPSKPRESAPVIRPLPAGSQTQVEKNPSQRSTREEIAAYVRDKRANLQTRKRH